MRTAIAAVAAGLALFVWGVLAYTVLPLGTMGLSAIPSAREEVVLATMKSAIPEPGLYFYPWLDPGHHADESALKAWAARAQGGPAGLLLYHPTGERFMMNPVKLASELAANFACALLVTLVIARLRGATFLRALVGLAFALFGWLSIQLSFWNFYGFPAAFTLASLVIESVGGLLVGLVAARIVPPQR